MQFCCTFFKKCNYNCNKSAYKEFLKKYILFLSCDFYTFTLRFFITFFNIHFAVVCISAVHTRCTSRMQFCIEFNKFNLKTALINCKWKKNYFETKFQKSLSELGVFFSSMNQDYLSIFPSLSLSLCIYVFQERSGRPKEAQNKIDTKVITQTVE